jgi:hypothetical protein
LDLPLSPADLIKKRLIKSIQVQEQMSVPNMSMVDVEQQSPLQGGEEVETSRATKS